MAVDPGPIKWIFDSSSLIKIFERQDRKKALNAFVKLVGQGKIRVPKEAWDELDQERETYLSLKPYRRKLVVNHENDADFNLEVGKIAAKHQGMVGITLNKNRADPYVIALAERLGVAVVADETSKKRRHRKIPGVCQARNTPCVNLRAFLMAEFPNDDW